jgi:hypothetical protein
MKSHRPELLLGIVLLAVFLAFWAWQTPGRSGRLSAGEVDSYIQRLQGRLPGSPAEEAEFLARLRAWGNADDGRPVYMLNLMSYYDRLKRVPGAEAISGTPVEVNAVYESAVTPIAFRLGAAPVFAGDAQRIDAPGGKHGSLFVTDAAVDDSDRILVLRYPSRRAFFRLVNDPDYLEFAPYKFSALKVGLVPMSGQLMLPDPTWLLGGLLAILFLAFGWLRAARRSRSAAYTR